MIPARVLNGALSLNANRNLTDRSRPQISHSIEVKPMYAVEKFEMDDFL